jgi:hypothetical protein
MTMKHLKFYTSILFSLMLIPNLHAAADTSLQPGTVKALIVIGDVQLVDSTGNHKPLVKGVPFTEGNTVIAGKDSGATLVLSNGATMRVKENGQLNITKFEQVPFDEAKNGTFMRLQRDPSQSITELDLRNGTLQGEVKELNKAANSSFKVNTPAGSAGIRGTVISITVTRDANGNVTGITANCSVGSIAFTPSATHQTTTQANGSTETITNSNVDVAQGATISIALTTNPTTGAITGATVSGANVSSAAVQAQVAELFTAINAIRADAGQAPIVQPTVTATSAPITVTSTTGTTTTVTSTVTATLDAPTVTISTIIPPSAPVNPTVAPVNAPLGSASVGTATTATSATTAATASTGSAATSTPTNPSIPVSPQ